MLLEVFKLTKALELLFVDDLSRVMRHLLECVVSRGEARVHLLVHRVAGLFLVFLVQIALNLVNLSLNDIDLLSLRL